MAFTYDAFLSYNSKDRDAVTAIARHLKEKAGLKLFFDQWEIIPGSPVQETLEKALADSAACVVFIGPSGFGNFQNEEMRIALEKRITEKDIRVIPVLLPGGKRETRESALPPFLRRLSWVEFNDSPIDPGALHRLVCGIKNISPGTDEKRTVPSPDICPYRGLEVFREQDSEFFFGRESMVQRLMARLQSSRFLALIGPSGSGKSSVVQAGLIPSLRSDSLIVLLTPRERPLEELALALRKVAAPGQLQYSTAEIIKQLSDSGESLHYLAREILQSLPADQSNTVQRFVIIVDQLEEIFTLTPLEQDRRKFINLLLRAVEIAGGPVTVILAMRSDFIGKCAPYRDLNIYFSEHLDQVEPMTAVELQTAIENPAKSVGLEFDAGLVEVMLADVKGSGSELPLVEHALLELFNYQPRPGNRLTAQTYEAIGRIEGALVRRAEKLYKDMIPSQQETLRKMFLLGLIQPGEGVPDTRRRALKEELLDVGGNAAEAEKLLYRLATARLLTIGHEEDSGQDTVEVAHEALIRNWGRIGEWMAEGRELARQRGILRQAAREWDENGKKPEYLFQGARLAQMEEFVSVHQQDLGTIEKEFIAAGTVEREALQRKKRRSIQVIIGALMVVLLVVTFFWYRAHRSEKKASRQLAVNYWDTAQRMRMDKDNLKSLHLFCEALTIERDKGLREALIMDMIGLWRTKTLLHIFTQKGNINGARFSKDGTRILTCSDDGTTRFWEAVTCKPIGKILKHGNSMIGAVNGAIFNKNETCILTWSGNPILKRVIISLISGSAKLWDVVNGKTIGEVMKHEDVVSGAIFNKKETHILTWSEDGTARLWDASNGKPIGEVMKHDGSVLGAIFNQDGNRILTWSYDGTARLWDAGNGKPIGEAIKHDGPVSGAIFNHDETRIFTWSNDGTARLWDAGKGKPIGEILKHDGPVNGVTFNHDETRILTWSEDGTVRLWEAVIDKPNCEVMKHENEVKGAIYNKNETRILTWSWDKTARLWDASTGKPIGEVMEHGGAVWRAIFNKDETRILTWSLGKTARLWDASNGKAIGEVMKHGRAVWRATFNYDGTRILTWGDDKTVRLWDASNGKTIGKVMIHEDDVNGAIFSPDGTRILTWSYDYLPKKGTARLWNASTSKPIGETMKHGDRISGAILNYDGTRILTWSDDETARLWDASNGKPIGAVMKHKYYVTGAIFSPDETRILTWSWWDRTARLWEAATGKLSGEVMKHGGRILRAIFNKKGTRILTWSDDKTARLWDASNGKPIGEVIKHGDTIEGAIFNNDGTHILTWSWDTTARLWDAATGKPIGRVMKHEDDVKGAIFNRDETRILTRSDDKTARLWDAATGKPIGEIMKHEEDVKGAIFNKDEDRILTWSGNIRSKIGTARLWDIAIDPDFPIDHIKLQVMAITGTFYDANTNTVNVIPPAKWREIKEQYMELAGQHYKSCRFPEGNVFRRLFPKEAQKIRPYPPKPDKSATKRD